MRLQLLRGVGSAGAVSACVIVTVITAVTMMAAGCGREASTLAPPRNGAAGAGPAALEDAGWVGLIDNPYFPLIPGTVLTYEGEEDGEPALERVHVTSDTRTILGVVTTVVLDSVWVNGLLVEATADWYAQDEAGNVWYFGEDTKEFDEQGNVVSTEGSWEAGVDGAEAGIIMEADPRPGDTYYQEFYPGIAEDQARVLSRHASVKVPFGHFHHALKTREWTELEPGVAEVKYYAYGVGLVASVVLQGGTEFFELVSVSRE